MWCVWAFDRAVRPAVQELSLTGWENLKGLSTFTTVSALETVFVIFLEKCPCALKMCLHKLLDR